MATYLDRRQISHRRAIQRRYDADQQRMATLITMILSQYARIDADGNRVIPTDNRTRLAIKAAIWSQVLKPYYIGTGSEPFNEANPLSSFARLIRDGVEGAIRIQVQRQIALLKRYIKDTAVLAWLTGANTLKPIELPPVRQNTYQQPFYAYTDPNGYKLNDRIQRNAIDTRTKIDRMVDHHILAGTGVALLGGILTNFMTISGRSTGKPYGEYGSYAPWLLARSEMVTAAGRAMTVASEINPIVDRLWWRVSTAHVEPDACDENASGGPHGDGIYPVGSFPKFPNHPGEQCSIIPVVAKNMDEIRLVVVGHITNNSPTAQLWRGTMHEESLIRALMTEPTMETTQDGMAILANRRREILLDSSDK